MLNLLQSLLRRRQVSQVVAGAGLLLAVPMAVAIGSVLRANERVLHAENLRLSGVEYARATAGLALELQKHRGMSAALLSGDASFREKLAAKGKDVETRRGAVDAVDARIGPLLGAQPGWAAARKKWQELQGAWPGMTPPQSIAAHTALIEDVVALQRNVVDNSRLAFNEDPETYFLARGLFVNLTWLTEYLGRARAIGSAVAARKELDVDTRLRLSVLLGQFRQASAELSDALERAGRSAGKDRYSALGKEGAGATERFAALLNDKILKAERIEIPATDYFEAATATIGANVRVLEQLEADLANQMQARVADAATVRNLILAAAAVAAALAGMVFLALRAHLRASVSRLTDFAHACAAGDLTVRLRVDGRDEFASIAVALNDAALNI